MHRFTSIYVNKVDQKGRVSVPASFRTVLEEQGAVFYMRVLKADGAIEAMTSRAMDDYQAAIDRLPLNSPERRRAERRLFGTSIEMRCDPDGRIILPRNLMDAVGIDGQAMFVGKGLTTFEIWSPERFDALMEDEADDDPILPVAPQRGDGGHG
jgi:MraZ protein